MPEDSPHAFRPLQPWDLRPGGRCRWCYLPMSAHPIHYGAPARLPGDKRRAELSFQALSDGFCSPAPPPGHTSDGPAAGPAISMVKNGNWVKHSDHLANKIAAELERLAREFEAQAEDAQRRRDEGGSADHLIVRDQRRGAASRLRERAAALCREQAEKESPVAVETPNLRATASNVIAAWDNQSPGAEKWDRLREKIDYLRGALNG